MTKTTTYLLGILITILAGSYFFYTCCSECGKVSDSSGTIKVEAPILTEATSFPFAFADGTFEYNVNENFNFNNSSYTILEPLALKVTAGLPGLITFLSENKGKVLNITGYYKSDETNTSAFPNLGIARANAVKNYLVAQGISPAQVNTFGEVRDDMVPKENMYLGPVTYEISGGNDKEADQLKALYEKINATPLVLYFETGEASIDLTPDERQMVADISKYLDKIEDATCHVVGHTDNTGTRDSNLKLGQERAGFVKSYLVKNGIPESKITVSSKGPDMPIVSNATDDGKAKNRRTVITLH